MCLSVACSFETRNWCAATCDAELHFSSSFAPRACAVRACLTVVLQKLSALCGAGCTAFHGFLGQEISTLNASRTYVRLSPLACLLAHPCARRHAPLQLGLGRLFLRHRCVVREDGKGEVVIAGLEEKEAMDAEGLEALIADGNRNRTTHATESNDQSSRWVGFVGSWVGGWDWARRGGW